MAKKAELTKTTNQAVVPFDYGSDAGDGMDYAGDDLILPLFILAQDKSKVCEKRDPKYIEGCEAGKIVDTSTKKLYDELTIVLAKRKLTYEEWLKEEGKTTATWQASHPENSPLVAEALLANGGSPIKMTVPGKPNNLLQETRAIYGIIIDPETEKPIGRAFIPFDRSKLQAFKAYWTLIDTEPSLRSGVPIYAMVAKLTVTDEHKKGEYFKGYSLMPRSGDPMTSLIGPDHPAYESAKQMAEGLKAGTMKVDMSQAADTDNDETTDKVFK